MARGHEHRIVAEALLAAWRPHQSPIDPALEAFGLPIVRPSDGERAGEMRVMAGLGAGYLDVAPYPLHRPAEVAVAHRILGPASGKDSGKAVEGIDRKPTVVG